MPLSLCMIVKNEEQLLGGCLDAMIPFVDECIVVDTGSTDRTVEIARARGARVITFPWTGTAGPARNVYLEHARGDWVMVLDADESIALDERTRLRDLTADGADAWMFTVYNYNRGLDLLDRWYPNVGDYPDEEQRSQCPGHSRFDVVRLFRRRPEIRYETGATEHCNPLRSMREAAFTIQSSDIVIHHFQFLKGGESFINAKQRQRLETEILNAQQDPNHFLAHLNAGRSLFSMGRDEEALGYLSRAIEIDPMSDRAWLARGILQCETGHEAKAVGDLVHALRANPQSADAWTVLGMTLHRLGRLKRAEWALLSALRHHPMHPLALNSLGVVYMDIGNFTRAEGMFQRSLDILPGHAAAACNLADLYDARGDHDAAERVLVTAMAARPDDPALGEALSMRQRIARSE